MLHGLSCVFWQAKGRRFNFWYMHIGELCEKLKCHFCSVCHSVWLSSTISWQFQLWSVYEFYMRALLPIHPSHLQSFVQELSISNRLKWFEIEFISTFLNYISQTFWIGTLSLSVSSVKIYFQALFGITKNFSNKLHMSSWSGTTTRNDLWLTK